MKQIDDKEAPLADGSESNTRALKLLHPDDTGETVELTGEQWQEDLAYLADLKESMKANKDQIAKIENKIKAAMGSATYANIGEYAFSYKTQNRKPYYVKASKSRVLRKIKRKDA